MSNEGERPAAPKIPRNKEHDYTREAAAMRRDFVKDHTGVGLRHVAQGPVVEDHDVVDQRMLPAAAAQQSPATSPLGRGRYVVDLEGPTAEGAAQRSQALVDVSGTRGRDGRGRHESHRPLT